MRIGRPSRPAAVSIRFVAVECWVVRFIMSFSIACPPLTNAHYSCNGSMFSLVSGRRIIETMDHEPDFVRDTDSKSLEVFYEIQRRRSPGEKLNDVFELTDWMIQLAERGVRMRYPGIGEREVFLRAAALRIPRDLMIKAYGWDPEAHG